MSSRYPCRSCIYMKQCGNTNRTEPCEGRQTKSGKEVTLKKRSQAERLVICDSLLTSVWDEFLDGAVDENILQVAVYCQQQINRIVWKLNERRNANGVHGGRR